MKNELEVACTCIKEAGHRAMQLSKEGFEVFQKKDNSPVTSADLEVNRILQEGLLKAFPEDGWLSEETPDDPIRLKKSRVWIIDPIDGTSYFIKGAPQFSISVALIENQQPQLGVVFNPATEEWFTAIRGKGAFLNGLQLNPKTTPNEKLTVLVNPSRLTNGEFQPYQELANCEPMGSIAYTLALVAAGQADATLNFDHLHEWDIAAGVLLVEEAGGAVKDRAGNPLTFNQPITKVMGVLAAKHGASSQVEQLLASVTKTSISLMA